MIIYYYLYCCGAMKNRNTKNVYTKMYFKVHIANVGSKSPLYD